MAPRPRPRLQRQRRFGNSRAAMPRSQSINPSTYSQTPIQARRFRFEGTTAATAQAPDVVTRAALLSLMFSSPGVTAANTSTVTSMISSARIKRLTLWTAGSFSFEWLSNLGPAQRITRDMVSSIVTPLVMSPPRNSRASFWSNTSGLAADLLEGLFALSVETLPSSPSNAIIIDLDVEYTVSNEAAATIAVTWAGNQNIQAGIYYAALDNQPDSHAHGGLFNYPPAGIAKYGTTTPTGFTLSVADPL